MEFNSGFEGLMPNVIINQYTVSYDNRNDLALKVTNVVCSVQKVSQLKSNKEIPTFIIRFSSGFVIE
jgi:hypothetical protein